MWTAPTNITAPPRGVIQNRKDQRLVGYVAKGSVSSVSTMVSSHFIAVGIVLITVKQIPL